jgi:hypothetical protein
MNNDIWYWDLIVNATDKFFQLHICENTKSLVKHTKTLGRIFNVNAKGKCIAGFLPVHNRDLIKTNPTYENDKNCFGIIILSKEEIDVSIVTHECLHAALFYERYINKHKSSYNKIENEERLAYLVEQFTLSVFDVLIKNKYITRINQIAYQWTGK